MKTPVVPFLLGGMTVFGVWYIHASRNAADKAMRDTCGSAKQAFQKFKEKKCTDDCSCQSDQ